MAAISIRPAVQTDHRFIEDTMVATLRDNSAFCKGLHPATLSALVDPVLATYQILVATPEDAEDTILGFLVFQDHETVAFVYVRSQFRSAPRCAERDAGGVRCGLASRHDLGHAFDHVKESGQDRVGGGVARALLARAGIVRGVGGRSLEIACAFMVTKMDGLRGQAFGALADSKGLRLRFRPYAPLEATARALYGDAGKAHGR